jgi:hypothetical protein
MKTCIFERSRVPTPTLLGNERPHYTPREDTAQQNRYIHNVGADHADSNICRREVKEKPEI